MDATFSIIKLTYSDYCAELQINISDSKNNSTCNESGNRSYLMISSGNTNTFYTAAADIAIHVKD